MPNQKYRDLCLVFEAPSGERYQMLSGISDKVQKPFSEIYFEFLNDVLKTKDEGNLVEETLSIVLDEEIRIGHYCLTYQRWFEERDGFSKFTSFTIGISPSEIIPINIHRQVNKGWQIPIRWRFLYVWRQINFPASTHP